MVMEEVVREFVEGRKSMLGGRKSVYRRTDHAAVEGYEEVGDVWV